jgi:hypothetical protein
VDQAELAKDELARLQTAPQLDPAQARRMQDMANAVAMIPAWKLQAQQEELRRAYETGNSLLRMKAPAVPGAKQVERIRLGVRMGSQENARGQ